MNYIFGLSILAGTFALLHSISSVWTKEEVTFWNLVVATVGAALLLSPGFYEMMQ